MSAIAGIYEYGGGSPATSAIETIMHELRKYPADAVRIWNGETVSFGCHAQWITPESVHECLPYYDRTTGLAITADAIIDNREDLFRRLQVDRNRRVRMTDSELIILAYLNWGKEAPRYLIGDYAFVLWDERRRLLFGARDLLGNRTLYYRRDHERFSFCTAIQPLLALPGIQVKLNESWFAEFLAIPLVQDCVDVHATAYDRIELLPPAHSFTVQNGAVVVEQYDQLSTDGSELRFRSNGEYEEAFRHVFQEAVDSKLRTYRQAGISLSGGLDSCAIAAFASKPLRERGKTLYGYSYVPPSDFTDWTSKRFAADERPYIHAAAKHIGNIAESYLSFQGRDSFGDIDDLIDLMEGPYKFLENSFWLKGIAETAAQQDVGVLLNGARGNYTISWGPALDYYALLLRRLRWLKLYRELKLYGRRTGYRRSRLLRAIGKQAFPGIAGFRSSGRTVEGPRLIHPDFAARTNVFEKLVPHDVGIAESLMNEFEAREYQFRDLSISNHQGVSTTKFSLRYRLWERDPTADPRVIRFCLSIPVEQYVQNGFDRSLVRRATEGRLPDEVRMNQRVRGIQGADWIHRMLPNWGAFINELKQLCQDPAASYYLNVAQIKQSMSIVGTSPKPELAYDPHVRLLMQGLIAYRFLQRFSS